MFSKDEKKHYLLKFIAATIVIFLIALAFIEPKPNVQHIEKTFNVQSGNVQ